MDVTARGEKNLQETDAINNIGGSGGLDMISDGFHSLPQGKLATLVTWLSREVPATKAARNLPEDLQLQRLTAANADRYLTLFRAVGERWMWFSRLRSSRDELAAILDDPQVFAFVLIRDGLDVGLLEMDYRDDAIPELSFLGLVSDAIGQGYGKLLMGVALDHAVVRDIKVMHLHSCTFDHQGALAFYSAMGFEVTRREVEVFTDPRIDGTIAPGAVAGFPL